MSASNEFYTFKGYQTNSSNELTATMEDYLEMIYRILTKQSVVRIGELSQKLNVRPSSATKIVQNLKLLGYLQYEKYEYIQLTAKGTSTGKYLLYRHNVLQNFLCTLNHSADELEQVEKIEHFFNKTTIQNIENLTSRLQDDF
ncbi:iron-dependent transcriptional repressor [Lachnospiraceae bacterium KM106-2]|nr:iron-dependent transcriptional repressor [Lachnospiraceae bacterium KM106-2]